jgi:hypothetical protein
VPHCVKYNHGIVLRLEQLSSGSGVSLALTEFLCTLGDVRGKLSRRLHTTIEEENSEGYFCAGACA